MHIKSTFQFPRGRDLVKKCENIANGETSLVSLKSGHESVFDYAIFTPEFGLSSNMPHLIHLNCTKNNEIALIAIKNAPILIENVLIGINNAYIWKKIIQK